jgi:DNA-binding MarR family transcriptional regulator
MSRRNRERTLREPETNTTYLLGRAHTELNRRIFDGVVGAGHDIRRSHATVFINIDRAGSRLTQLAERASMTPQAMGELVDDLVERGYVERVPDPADRRAKLILLTDLGWDALQAAFDTILDIEAELQAELGQNGLARLQRALRRIAEPQE